MLTICSGCLHTPHELFTTASSHLQQHNMRLLLLAFVPLALASLVRINDKNFKDVVVNSGKYVLVDFYADWCRHCMTLMPTIEELAEKFAYTPEIDIVKLNGDEDGRKMTSKYKIEGFPTLLLFHGTDKPIEYSGLRDAESIGNFIQLASGVRLRSAAEEFLPLVLQLSDFNFQNSVLRANHKTLVLFSSSGDKTALQLHTVWNELTEIFKHEEDQIRFGRVNMHLDNKAQVKNMVGLFAISHSPMILYFDPQKVDPDGLKRPAYYSGELTSRGFVDFVNSEAGTNRDTDGNLKKTAGRIPSIENFFAKNRADALPIIGKIEEQLEEKGLEALVLAKVLQTADDLPMLAYYKRAIGYFVEGGKASLERESQRLKNLLANSRNNIDSKALDYMQKRSNVLEGLLGRRS